MKNAKGLIVLLLSLSLVSLLSCKKGDEGPAGPSGPTGATGAQGTQGAAGPAGTANVIYSKWTNGSTWAIDAVSGLNVFDIPATALTQDILSKGDVHVYWGVLGDTINNVRQLPFIETVGSDLYFHNVKLGVGMVKVESNNLFIANTNRYRYILVPGGTLGGKSANATINFADYAAVKRLFNIPD